MSKTVTTALFIIGLLLALAGFLLASIEHIPALFNIVSPSYVHARSATDKLREREPVGRGETGFESLERLLMAELVAQNPAETLADVSVLRFEHTGAVGIGFGENDVTKQIPIRVHLSTGQTIDWNLVNIDKKIEGLRTAHLFWWSVGLFVLGMILQIVSFVIE